ncbi:MAG: hypothetical protein NPIRA06_20960 [Nitrospirales bacterium]|nr:MAG: hypothetical protein NPIRA06_20960 [Nitrospirales bacterium]
MNTFMKQFPSTAFRLNRWIICLLSCGVALGLSLSDAHVFAEASTVPWECSEYSVDAQTRCIRTLKELQQRKIDQLAEQLKTQEGIVKQLKKKLDRQEASDLSQVQTSQQNFRYRSPYISPYAYSYGYAQFPPIGIYLQPPWAYPRNYGYGPGYWGYGPPALGYGFRFGGGHHHYHR